MSRIGKDGANRVQEEIRRQFGSAGTTRFLKSLPTFEVDDDVPDRFSSLLGELDRVESERRDSRSNGSRPN
jgi:hypothetical protein